MKTSNTPSALTKNSGYYFVVVVEWSWAIARASTGSALIIAIASSLSLSFSLRTIRFYRSDLCNVSRQLNSVQV